MAKPRKSQTFHGYVDNKNKKRHMARLKGISPWLIGGAVFVAIVIGQAAYFFTNMYFTEKAARKKLESRRFLEHSAQVTIEGGPAKMRKNALFAERAVAFLAHGTTHTGYRFPTPMVYSSPTGDPVSLGYQMLRGTINEREVEPELLTPPRGGRIGALGLRDDSTPLQKGENVFEVDYRITGIPLQDEAGQEKFRWQFPRQRISIIDEVEVFLILPRYAQLDKVVARSRIVNIPTKKIRKAEPEVIEEVVLKDSVYPTVSFKGYKLDSHEVLEVMATW